MGYTSLVERFGLQGAVVLRRSFIGPQRTTVTLPDGVAEETFTAPYDPGDDPVDQLVFALKYDGIDLLLLRRIFAVVDVSSFASSIAARPTSVPRRRLWFLFEWLTGTALPLDDLRTGNYAPLFNPDEYIVLHTWNRSRRHRIDVNALGGPKLCPIVRRTEAIERGIAGDLSGRARAIGRAYDPCELERAIRYLYEKETRSTYAIEHETPPRDRRSRFVRLERV